MLLIPKRIEIREKNQELYFYRIQKLKYEIERNKTSL